MASGVLPPYSHTPLAALPALALDLETTGLIPQRDRIVQVACIAMLGARVLDEPSMDRLVNPGVPIPPAATRIHGITDADVDNAQPFAGIVDELRERFAGRVVVGHHIAFDLAVLRHEAARAGVAWRDPPSLDVGLIVGALEPSIREPDLETVTRLTGVTIGQRHRAFDDAMAAAETFARLIPHLRDADIRTLGEAQAFSARRSDLALRQAQAGWHTRPDPLPPAADVPGPARIDAYVFERRLESVMKAPAVAVAPGTTLREAARLMTRGRIGAVLVGNDGEAPRGIVSERDLLRVTAAADLDPDRATVDQVMSAPVETMGAGEMLYRALGRMDRKGIRHLCIVDEEGKAVGMVSQRDLLQHRARSALAPGDAIATADDAPALAAAYAVLPDVASRLVAEGVGGTDVARVVASEIRALTARAAQIAESRLRGERGAAPAPWCLLVLGSAGRGESLLAADQDNALIHAGSEGDDPWFAALGELAAGVLDEAGLPRCKGGVMAANAAWRGNQQHWRERVAVWLARARPEDLLDVDIFFDLAPVAGDAALARRLHADAVEQASRTASFIALLAEWTAGLPSPVGWFGGLRAVAGRVDLKLGGLLPIVSIARTLALRVGSPARATPDRLLDAVAAGRLSDADAGLLIEIHGELLTLVLRQQLEDLAVGVRPSSRVAVGRLGRAGARSLARKLRGLDEILRTLRGTVSGS